MIRTYCDKCEVELFDNENRVTNRIIRSLGVVKVEVTVAAGGVWNDGHVCAKCVLETVNRGADL